MTEDRRQDEKGYKISGVPAYIEIKQRLRSILADAEEVSESDRRVNGGEIYMGDGNGGEKKVER